VEHQETLQDRQRQIEQDSLALGITRYRGDQPLPWQTKSHEHGETDLAPGKTLLKEYVQPVADALTEFVDAIASGKAGRRGVAAQYLVHIEPLQAAYLALRFAINGASAGLTFAATSRHIGDAIQEHLEMVAMAADHPGLHQKLTRQLARSTSSAHRIGVLRHVREKYDLERMAWSIRERIQIGSKMIELLLATTPLFALERHSRGRKDAPQYLVFTPETVEWLEKTHGRCELLSPIHLPMVAKPRKWRTPYSGGYLTNVLKPRLIRTRNRNYLDELGGVDLTAVMSAVNAVQETPWRISRKILDAVDEEIGRGGAVAGLPRQFDLPLPPLPAGIPEGVPSNKLTTAQREDLTAWKAKAAKIHAENATNEQERVVLVQKLYVARRFLDEAAIYFPHYLDFRGRVYPMASYLNPQGDDVCRGLLEFADGKQLGEDGAFWLAVHIAGLWGVDKVSFNDRVAWVREHEEQLLASALDPHTEDAFWRTAEKPWQALAACFDWLGYSLNGNDHVSHLPIAMDGSCSGLQHYSALLLDEVGGAAVNLVPGERPSDIYTMVAERAQVLSDGSLGGTDDSMARSWHGKFCRKVAKQPTMTLCYSATKFGMKGQIENALHKLDEDGPYLPADVDRYKAAIYASEVIWSSLGDVVVAARRAMGWLKKVSDVAVEAGVPIRWTSPIGLPVMQDYQDRVAERLNVYLGGRQIQLELKADTGKLSKRRQASGIAPNFVHSLDAAHLLSTVNLGLANGLAHFAMIHDSFGCHAADTSMLNAVLREAFVAQYSEPVLERFRDDIVAQLEVAKPELVKKIPRLPATGNLDLAAVKDSEFFFA
jgi:DNA-directed RNA polymerase